jgi:hypothetical protein
MVPGTRIFYMSRNVANAWSDPAFFSGWIQMRRKWNGSVNTRHRAVPCRLIFTFLSNIHFTVQYRYRNVNNLSCFSSFNKKRTRHSSVPMSSRTGQQGAQGRHTRRIPGKLMSVRHFSPHICCTVIPMRWIWYQIKISSFFFWPNIF